METHMFRFALTVLIATSVCVAQTSTAPKPSTPAKSQSAPASQTSKTSAQTPASDKSAGAAKPAEPAKEVPPTAAVVTLNGVCVKPDASGQCKTVITRAEFDRLANSINPSNSGANQPLRPEAKRQIATRYSQYLAFADGAKKQNLDQTPQAQELVHFAGLQALAQVYMNYLQGKSTPTPEEVTKYYDDNRARFEKITVRRILIPANPGPDAKNVTPESLKQIAQKLYERAKAGEDFDKLQKEAFTAAGISTAPDSKMVLNPAALPPQQQAVSKLKPGEISQPFTEVSGTYIYKMESSETTPLAAVKSDIEKVLQRQKFEETVKKMLDTLKPDLNEAYFGPAPAQGGVPAERD
jgi:parvulin-like peptidyl-prolyl isomerase